MNEQRMHNERVIAARQILREYPIPPRPVRSTMLRGTMGRMGWWLFGFGLAVFLAGIGQFLLGQASDDPFRWMKGWLGLGIGSLLWYLSLSFRWAWRTGLRWSKVGTARIEAITEPPRLLWPSGPDYQMSGQWEVRTATRTFRSDFLVATPWANRAYVGQVLDVVVHPRRNLVLIYLVGVD